jgi:hypothetical protein
MNEKKDIVIAVLATICLMSVLFAWRAYGGWPYNSLWDTNNDGVIDTDDLARVAGAFGTHGEAGNASHMYLEQYWDNFQDLPAQASFIGKYLDPGNMLLSIDISPGVGAQRITAVDPGETVQVNLTFQLWSAPGIIKQSFVIYSWAPSWPPPSGYYTALYNGIPGSYPGQTVTSSFYLTAPTTPGRYYLWFCGDAQYNMQDAINRYTHVPRVPAHAEIIVVEP